MENPHFNKVELEISSVFDSVIFQLSSLFDYISHMICYICKKNKSKTHYWPKLAYSAYGQNNEFTELNIRNVIVELDKAFIGRLYDYRSELLHNKRDKHNFTTSVNLKDFEFNVQILASETALQHFKLIRDQHPDKNITLTYLSSWLIKQSFHDIEKLLDALRVEILKRSNFHSNLKNPKAENGWMIISVDQATNVAKPVSEGLWDDYKRMK